MAAAGSMGRDARWLEADFRKGLDQLTDQGGADLRGPDLCSAQLQDAQLCVAPTCASRTCARPTS